MKKLLLSILILFCLQFAPTKAQWVTIPDAEFANWLNNYFPNCMNGNQLDTTCSQMLATSNIHIIWGSIFDLTGIRYFDSLDSLKIYSNDLNNLPHLPPSLLHLNVSHNNLTSLPPLPLSLRFLHCSNNSITSLPPLPPLLETLIVGANDIDTLPALPNTLTFLSCGWNPISFLPYLPNSIEILHCMDCQLSSLPFLPSNLKDLRCELNQITNLPPLPSTLQRLDCYQNQIANISVIPATLNHLNCGGNQLTYIPEVPLLMDVFNVSNNQITCLTNIPNVPVIYNNTTIANNPLTCVPNQTGITLGLPLCIANDPVINPFNCESVVNITGAVFSDLDADCAIDSTNEFTNNLPVKLFDVQNNFLGMSYTVNGLYSFSNLQTDSFLVKIEDNVLPIQMTCNIPNSQIVNLNSNSQSVLGINFPVVCDTIIDYFVQSVSHSGLVFPGQIHQINTNILNNFSWYNLVCDSSDYSGTVSIHVSGPVSFVGQAVNALVPQVNGNTYSYSISNLGSLTPSSLGLLFITDTTAQAVNTICIHVEINPTLSDADTMNNSYDFCYNVVNSYDPNMKEVYPINVLPGYDDWFTYTIHFQNTGNAPAITIRLRDTLDANLDNSTFEMRGYSHPAIVSLNGNILTISFNNIMLPDSTSDYEGSMGYFQYRLKPLPNLPNGTQIENTAYIYFDYNAPIITNTTQNNFDLTVKTINTLPQASHLSLYPNPSNGIFTFNESKNVKSVEVFNMMGELVLSQGNAKIINLQAYPKGIYVARINGSQVCRLVKE